MKLETQLQKLAELGFLLNPGITLGDLLHSFDRQVYEDDPFEALMFMFGVEVESEPWGRRICDQVWNFDTECISGTGDYVDIVRKLCLLSGDPDYLSDITDHVDMNAGEGWLEYTVQGRRQRWATEVNNDWADTLSLSYVMNDLERGGRRFYSQDNGQSMILLFQPPELAARLARLTGQPLTPIVPD